MLVGYNDDVCIEMSGCGVACLCPSSPREIEKNVARDPSAMQDLMSLGLRVLPVIVIGDKRLSGFNPKEIEAALAGENDQAEAARL
jgi:hypothetical protein